MLKQSAIIPGPPSTVCDVDAGFARSVPRLPLAQLPTPLQSTELGWGNHRLWVKRDDLTGCALTGNKIRKLEYLLADARDQDADHLLTCGSVQSNCARSLAIAAARVGLPATLILNGPAHGGLTGNLLLARLTGCDVIHLADADDSARDAALFDLDEQMRRAGRRPYIVPFGGSSPVGTFGYVPVAFELRRQLVDSLAQPRHCVMPLASGGTYAGLYLGCRLARLDLEPIGAFVLGTASQWRRDLATLINATATRFALPIRTDGSDLVLLDARGEGYGRPDAAELATLIDFSRRTGLILDPVYTGKAYHAFTTAIDAGAYRLRGDVIFLHTGGTFGLFPYSDQLDEALATATDRVGTRTNPGGVSRPADSHALIEGSPGLRSSAHQR